MKFICYPKCTTCKKAAKWLESKGIEYSQRNIKEEKPSYNELKEWYEKSGLPLKRFFNTSGLLYRSMNLKDKLDNMTDEEKLRLLAGDGMLVKRPLLITRESVLVGFRESEWEKLL
ncbi:MAG: arsenate reductase family protein [Ruminococcus sp.]|nr:arsenate reductase family protein [Ruminococcus sp.]